MSETSAIREQLAAYNEDMLFLDPPAQFDKALVGVVETWREQIRTYVACYDLKKLLECLVRDGMTHEEAQEHIDFNITSAYLGVHTPVYLERVE